MKTISEYIGKHYIFGVGNKPRLIYQGYFAGLGNFGGRYGMLFIDVNIAGKNMSKNTCLFIDPSDIKGTMYQNILELKRTCKELLKNKPTRANRLVPISKVEEFNNV